MDPALRVLLASGDGVVTRAGARAGGNSWAFDWSLRRGELVRVFPGVCRSADTPADGNLLRRAALAYTGDRATLSHLTALAVWGLRRTAAGEPVHLTVPRNVRVRSRPGLVVHTGSTTPAGVVRGGLQVTRVERSLVDSWPLLPAGERRPPIIRAVNNRATTPDRLTAALAGAPRLPGRAELRALLDRLVAGCRSELEIWGHDHVFTGPGMPAFRRQVPVRVAGRSAYLDVMPRRSGSTSSWTVPPRTAPLASARPTCAAMRCWRRWASWWCASPTTAYSTTPQQYAKRSLPSWQRALGDPVPVCCVTRRAEHSRWVVDRERAVLGGRLGAGSRAVVRCWRAGLR